MLALLEILGFILEFLYGLVELVTGWMEWRKKRATQLGTHATVEPEKES